jgi:hypothetical protein
MKKLRDIVLVALFLGGMKLIGLILELVNILATSRP